MKNFNFTLNLSVSDYWIEDGFNPSEETIVDAIRKSLLTYSYENEFLISVKKNKNEVLIDEN